MPKLAKRGVWCGPSDAGRDKQSVRSFVDQIERAGFNLVVMELKHGGGSLSWPSHRFPEAVSERAREFDLPAVLLEECRKRRIELHAWMIDYFEGENGAAYKAHPEWTALDARGNPTSCETLRRKRYGATWMCPARRPGYTDQWLVPLYEEFATLYDFDGIHHDYIRYPGDLAPDQYCFCDYCLEQLPRYAGYASEAFPDEPFYHRSYDRPYLEAHWEESPRVLPANWESLDRTSKSRFLLEGSFFQGGRNDLDFFFYQYRIEAVAEFARMAAEAVRRARPAMKVSAAVFKNPVHSGRFIGQDWRRFIGLVDELMPMDYRSHYPGDFETHLALLRESILSQQVWAKGFKALYPGIAVNFLYFEEEDAGRPCKGEKLARAIETVAETGVEGMMIFAASLIERYGVWDAAREAFGRYS